ncbi:arginine--tRNA ligase [Paenibacillus sp. M1]|uniref:Arginine--tRNA ligase n=1 Tax=Paenibacillus haidiansis TaxID=1574488 RepID=A0ABU7VYR9_9BACL
MDQFKHRIAANVASLLEGIPAEEIRGLLEVPPGPAMGDLSLPCFKLSKALRKSPTAIAEELADGIQGGNRENVIANVSAVSGYLNIRLDRTAAAREVLPGILSSGENYGSQTAGEGKTIVIDFSSPNIAKPFHVGHLRSTVIGAALYRIFNFLGYRCVGINHLGDWGTQFGKLITAYRRWGDSAKLEQGAIDELLGLYVRFHEEAERDPALEEEARAWFAKMERGDEEALALWRKFVDVSLAEFAKIYELLGVTFDFVTGESFYNDRMGPVIQELKQKGLLVEDQGAWLVRLDDYDMAPALMLKQDGSSLYHTRDVAAAIYRKDTYDFHKAIYVTDYSQSLHFRQWFKVVELMGYDWAQDLVHVPFGRVSLEGASLSTRKGNVVKLEELLTQAISKIGEIIESKNPGLAHKEEVARQVGVGAVIFNDLSGNRIKDIEFSWEDALSFEGETGPYVQYTYARASSVLRKGAGRQEQAALSPEYPDGNGTNVEPDNAFDSLTGEAEFALVKQLSLFPEKVEQAAAKLEPSIVTRYLVDAAQAFNRFYHDCPILTEDRALRSARLALVQCVQITLRNGLSLIGLKFPEEM